MLKGTSTAVAEERENVSHFPYPHFQVGLEILMTRLHETSSLHVRTSPLNCMPLLGQLIMTTSHNSAAPMTLEFCPLDLKGPLCQEDDVSLRGGYLVLCHSLWLEA